MSSPAIGGQCVSIFLPVGLNDLLCRLKLINRKRWLDYTGFSSKSIVVSIYSRPCSTAEPEVPVLLSLRFWFSPVFLCLSGLHDTRTQNHDCFLWIWGEMGVSNLIHGKYSTKVPFSESFQFSTLSRLNSQDLQLTFSGSLHKLHVLEYVKACLTTYYDKATLHYCHSNFCLCAKCKFIEHTEAVEKRSIFVSALRFKKKKKSKLFNHEKHCISY